MNKKITQEELEVFLRKHKMWLANIEGGEKANLRGANLREANLRGADLRGADLYGADLCEADLRGAENLDFPIVCPEEGEFVGFKKADGYIVKLKITDDAKRCSATSRKCRCSKAVVLSITTLDGTDDGTTEVRSDHDRTFKYKVGDTVEVNDFCEDRWKACSAGIHFFITRQEAVNY